MKKILILLIVTLFFTAPIFSAENKMTEEYLKNSSSFSMSFLGESIVNSAIKHSLKKEAPGKYKVKFKGYTLSSLKKGIFKYLEITGNNVNVDEIEIPYFNIKTVTDYNWIDYKQEPIVFKTGMEFDSEVHLSEKSINDALQKDEYNKIIRKINKKTFPLFEITNVNVKLKNCKMYIIISYNFPLSPKQKDKTFMVSSGLRIVNNEIKPNNVWYDSAYGNLPMDKVINLINLLNPMNFTIKLIKDKNAECKIKEIKIIDDIVIINGKIYVKGEK